MKKMISLLLTTVLAASTITVPAFAAVHAKDEYGQTIYVEGDKLNKGLSIIRSTRNGAYVYI